MGVLTCLIWVRSFFGFFFLFGLGIALGVAAWKLPSTHIRNLYIILAVTCTLNSITSIQVLFGENQVVNGQPSSTDAHMMAVIQGGNHVMWALLWLVFALFCAAIGILLAIPGPDQVADFAICGVCQDMGLFHLCNRSLGICRRIRSTANSEAAENQNATSL